MTRGSTTSTATTDANGQVVFPGLDSGLDVDALRVVSEGVNRVREDGSTGVLLITHYTRILRYISPDFVHVFVKGRIAEEGGRELADELEENGYAKYGADAQQPTGRSLPAGPVFGGAVTPA
jgi:Fe-S cluster assembly ATPase SufC